eukprot:gene2080-1952_t
MSSSTANETKTSENSKNFDAIKKEFQMLITGLNDIFLKEDFTQHKEFSNEDEFLLNFQLLNEKIQKNQKLDEEQQQQLQQSNNKNIFTKNVKTLIKKYERVSSETISSEKKEIEKLKQTNKDEVSRLKEEIKNLQKELQSLPKDTNNNKKETETKKIDKNEGFKKLKPPGKTSTRTVSPRRNETEQEDKIVNGSLNDLKKEIEALKKKNEEVSRELEMREIREGDLKEELELLRQQRTQFFDLYEEALSKQSQQAALQPEGSIFKSSEMEKETSPKQESKILNEEEEDENIETQELANEIKKLESEKNELQNSLEKLKEQTEKELETKTSELQKQSKEATSSLEQQIKEMKEYIQILEQIQEESAETLDINEKLLITIDQNTKRK